VSTPLDEESGPGATSVSTNPLTISISRGIGRNVSLVDYMLVRELTADDVPRLAATSDSLRGGISQIKTLRQTHHLLAKAIASGKTMAEAAAISGYTQTTISVLKKDPAFIELVSLYEDDINKVYLDVHARMAALSISTLEELQDRFEKSPETFTKRELLDMFTALADRSIPTAKGGPAAQAPSSQGGTALQINFIQAKPKGEPGQVIEATAEPGKLTLVDVQLDDQ
jgi:hypothetical protein